MVERPGLKELREIERLRMHLGNIFWAVEAGRFGHAGLRAFCRQQCVDGLDLMEDQQEQEVIDQRKIRIASAGR